ncbi:MAG: aminoglycoside phosphotransferase family protein [Rhabdochlamydiaceae bacterium]|nr:aminoglycoside phosphotransferase family protein [Candidatus Amphrikana amoebophyrae]
MTKFNHLIISHLKSCYLIEVTELILLPVGADLNAFIYKIKSVDQKSYFVKLKLGEEKENNFEILEYLKDSGIDSLILPIKSIADEFISQREGVTFIIYPFVLGENGFTRPLTDSQWITLGQTMRKMHETQLPDRLTSYLPIEEFSSQWELEVQSLFQRLDEINIVDEISTDMSKFLKKNQARILKMTSRTAEIIANIKHQELKLVFCHADLHAGNILIDHKGLFYIVDWDAPILAPKERDLMFIGAGVGNVWNIESQKKLFYQEYGDTEINWPLIAYYRFNRILEDITEYSRELLFKSNGKNRSALYQEFLGAFLQNGVVDIAFKTDELISK